MERLKQFGMFWWDFVVGDDWFIAAAVVVGLALTATASHVLNVNAWWLMPVLVLAIVPVSIRRADRT